MVDASVGVVHSKPEESLETNISFNGRDCKFGLLNTVGPKVGKDEEPVVDVSDESRERKDDGDDGKDRMEFEEGGGIGISS